MHRLQGFTLIEIMIAIVIVALLTAVALPAYQTSLQKSRRAEGRSALLMAAQLQERWYSTYVPPAGQSTRYADNTELPRLFGLASGPVYSGAENPALATGYYQLTVLAPTAACPLASCFVIRAAPNGRHNPDADCGNLSLSSTGVRTESGTKDVDYCWGK